MKKNPQKKILVACEESQAVTIELRKLGHIAYSNDIQDCSGGHPEWHLQCDVFDAINSDKWEIMIAFPPCTYLSNAGIGWFNEERYGEKARQRKMNRMDALGFVKKLYQSKIDKVAIENPVGYLNKNFRKPDQIIQPYYFGDNDRKRTCLWLKNLPKLIHTKQEDLFYNKTHIAAPEPFTIHLRKPSKYYSGGEIKKRYFDNKSRDSKARSKTFPGIAKAMAEQWGGVIK